MTIKGYTPTAKFLHWLMAAIFIVAWLVGFYAGELLSPKDPNMIQDRMITLHKDIATTTMLLVVLRSAWRLTHQPPHSSYPSAFQRAAVWGGHLLLYVLMFVMPISGWLTSSAAGYPVEFAGIIPLPALVAKSAKAAAFYDDIHVYVGWFTGVVLLGHIGMALKHHFIDRDNTMLGMLPARKA